MRAGKAFPSATGRKRLTFGGLAAFVASLAVGVGGAPAASRAGCAAAAKWHGVQATNYKQNCQVCRQFGSRAVAKQYGIRSSTAATIALRYAQKSMRPGFQQAVYEGCLRGFILRGRP